MPVTMALQDSDSDTTPITGTIAAPVTMGEDKETLVKANVVRKNVQWFGCASCKDYFDKRDKLYAHINQFHTDEFPFLCDQCPKRFCESSQLKNHSRTHDPTRYQGDPQFFCEFCGKSYHLKISLTNHRKLKHLGYKPTKRKITSTLKMVFPRNKNAVQKSPKSSKDCSKLSENTTPEMTQNPENSLPSPVEEQKNNFFSDAHRFPCHHCGKRFASIFQRRFHETIHNPNRYKGEPQFACHLCDKKYHMKGSLDTHKLYAHLGRKRVGQKKRYPHLQTHHSTGASRRVTQSNSDHQPFKCDLCQQKFAHRASVTRHKKTVHKHGSPLTSLPTTFINNQQQSRDCPHCPRKFSLPSRLKIHLRLHTGELPHQCNSCDMRFRTTGCLRNHRKLHIANPLNTFKCRVCGKEGFKRFTDYKNHRLFSHAYYPYRLEKEKAFGCGICGKPYFLRENAIICALLQHDPTRLQEQMFRFKCPGCPDEALAHRNFLAVRNHWELEHPDKPMPGKYRVGMHNPNLKDELPTMILDKEKAKEIREKGIPSHVKYDFPLYVEFDLFQDVPLEKIKTFQCQICNKMLGNERSLKRHHLKIHVNGRKGKKRRAPLECTLCDLKFARGSNLRRHQDSLLHRSNVRHGWGKWKSGKQPTRKIKAPVIVSVASVKQEADVENVVKDEPNELMESTHEDYFLDGWQEVPVKTEILEGFGNNLTHAVNEIVREEPVIKRGRGRPRKLVTSVKKKEVSEGDPKSKRGRPLGSKGKWRRIRRRFTPKRNTIRMRTIVNPMPIVPMIKYETINVKDLEGIKRVLGNKEARLVLIRVNKAGRFIV